MVIWSGVVRLKGCHGLRQLVVIVVTEMMMVVMMALFIKWRGKGGVVTGFLAESLFDTIGLLPFWRIFFLQLPS